MAAYKNPEPKLDKPVLSTIDETIKKIENVENDSYNNRHENIYFAFIDVLGFKKTFLDDEGGISSKVTENKFDIVFKYYFKLMDNANFSKDGNETCYSGQTSDSLYFYTKREDFLLDFIKIFSHFNFYAMSQNVFFRGGIAKGNLRWKCPYQFYGDSVIKAYLLEEDIAKNPAVYIDNETHKSLKCLDGFDINLIKQDANSRYYIDPFSGFELDIRTLFKSDIIFEELNRDNVINNIETNKEKFEYETSNFLKYTYLINKYNETFNKTEGGK